jgi:hypothetical protein
MSFSRALSFLRRYREYVLLSSLLLLITGIRIYAGVRCLAELPSGDDATTLTWLQGWSRGVHNWSFIFKLHNGAHPLEFFYLLSLVQYQINGFWDGRLDFIVFCLVHSVYAAVAFFVFRNVLERRDRGWIYTLIFVVFALPFAGYRISLGIMWPNLMPMILGLLSIYLFAYHRGSWATCAAICVLSLVAAGNTGTGCLCALLIVVLTGFESGLARRVTGPDLTLMIVCLTIFLACYLNIKSNNHTGLGEGIGAFLKALAWPTVFASVAGLPAILPPTVVAFLPIIDPSYRRKNVTFLTGTFGLLALIAVGTGLLRGDNNNMGIPSGRYTEFFFLMPLVTGVALCLLYRRSTGGWRTLCMVFSFGWLCCQTAGFTIQIVYRLIPFISQETGEWNAGQQQVLFRQLVRGEVPLQNVAFHDDETLDITPLLTSAAAAHQPVPAMTDAMVAGFDLQPGSQGNYVFGGYHPSYQPRPMRLYRGSFDRANPAAADKTFVSGPFQPQAPYLTLDVIVDKKARFTNYRLDGLHLTLVDTTDGSRTEMLPRLARTYPFVFRDWEMIYARVIPRHSYRIESRDASAAGWLAFSEPLESGRLTPLIVGFCQSGKFFCLLGAGLLMLALYLRWLNHRLTESELGAI